MLVYNCLYYDTFKYEKIIFEGIVSFVKVFYFSNTVHCITTHMKILLVTNYKHSYLCHDSFFKSCF